MLRQGLSETDYNCNFLFELIMLLLLPIYSFHGFPDRRNIDEW